MSHSSQSEHWAAKSNQVEATPVAMSTAEPSPNPSVTNRQAYDNYLSDPTKELLVATALDASIIDDHLVSQLLAPPLVHICLSLFKNISSSTHERKWLIELISQAALRCLTLWSTNGQTPGVKLMGLQRQLSSTASRATKNSQQQQAQSKIFQQRLVNFTLLRIIVPTVYRIFKEWVHRKQLLLPEQVQSPGESAVSSDQEFRCQAIARQRQRQVAEIIINTVERILPVIQLVSLLACWSEVTTTPDPAMIVTGLEYTPSTQQKQQHQQQQCRHAPLLHVDYAHRRWQYNQGFQTLRLWTSGLLLVHTLWGPIINDTILRPVSHTQKQISQSLRLLFRKKRKETTTTNILCPLCKSIPVVRCKVQPCGHTYCYSCIYKEACSSAPTSSYPCDKCGDPIQSASVLE